MGRVLSVLMAIPVIALAGCGGVESVDDGGADAGGADGTDSMSSVDGASDTLSTDSPDSQVTPVEVLIASQQFRAHAIAVDSTNVYWTDYDGMGTISKCATSGCAGSPVILAVAQQFPNSLALDDANVYWANDDGTVMACAINGCAQTPTEIGAVTTTQFYYAGSLTLEASQLYWATLDAVVTCPVSGCLGQPTPIITGQKPTVIAVDQTTLYWTDVGDGGPSGGKIMTCAIAGCGNAPLTIASSLPGPYAITLDTKNIYWTDGNAVSSCSKASCASTIATLVSNETPSGPSILVDGSNLYWSTAQNVMQCLGVTCPSGAAVLAANQNPFVLAVDATSIYWNDPTNGTISKLTPK